MEFSERYYHDYYSLKGGSVVKCAYETRPTEKKEV